MSAQPEKFDLASMNIVETRKEKLKSLFPEIFTEAGKVDFDRLRLTLGQVLGTPYLIVRRQPTEQIWRIQR